MARIRITLEDDDVREINRDKERIYDLPVGAKRLVNIEAAIESFKQTALPELTAELLMLEQYQFVAEDIGILSASLRASWVCSPKLIRKHSFMAMFRS
jgi:hypothetical protein